MKRVLGVANTRWLGYLCGLGAGAITVSVEDGYVIAAWDDRRGARADSPYGRVWVAE